MGRYPNAVVITDGVHNAEVDKVGWLVSIEAEHHEVHKGDMYIISDIDADVDTASPKYWRITAPNTTKRIHVKIAVATDTGGLIEVYENPTVNAAGTGLTAVNADRNSSNTATATAFKDTTTTGDGTLIEVSRIGAGREKKFGGVARQFSEFILKQNEDYIIKCTPDSDNAKISINLNWYEI